MLVYNTIVLLIIVENNQLIISWNLIVVQQTYNFEFCEIAGTVCVDTNEYPWMTNEYFQNILAKIEDGISTVKVQNFELKEVSCS